MRHSNTSARNYNDEASKTNANKELKYKSPHKQDNYTQAKQEMTL